MRRIFSVIAIISLIPLTQGNAQKLYAGRGLQQGKCYHEFGVLDCSKTLNRCSFSLWPGRAEQISFAIDLGLFQFAESRRHLLATFEFTNEKSQSTQAKLLSFVSITEPGVKVYQKLPIRPPKPVKCPR